jgi:hypothetical protein
MGYVVAGYVLVLSLLFLYGVQLAWRRRRLARAVARVAATDVGSPGGASGGSVAGPPGVDR